MIYLGGALTVLVYRLFMAGQTDFTYGTNQSYYREDRIDMDKVMPYAAWTFAATIFWPLVLPGYGIYKLGKHFKKKG